MGTLALDMVFNRGIRYIEPVRDFTSFGIFNVRFSYFTAQLCVDNPMIINILGIDWLFGYVVRTITDKMRPYSVAV